MMAESTDEKKTVSVLPMGLAETNEGRASQRWLSILQKILALITFTLMAIGFYLLILKILQSEDGIHNTEIILVSGFREVDVSQNVSISQDNMEIIVQINNQTSKIIPINRKKRETLFLSNKPDKYKLLGRKTKYKDNKFQRAKKILEQHDLLCNEDNHKDVCRELVIRLKSLTDNKFENNNKKIDIDKNEKLIIKPTDIAKRETNNHSLFKPFNKNIEDTFDHTITHSKAYPRDVSSQLPDNCLLKRLMRQSYPNLHGIFDPHPEYQPLTPSFPRQFSSDFISSFLQNREVEPSKITPHPQDIAIALKLITPRHESTSKNAQSNTSVSEIECPIGTISCGNGNICVDEGNWCDGNVDCDDVSDESKCNCKSRVDESRICDGYFDCPFGEDEMGCYAIKIKTGILEVNQAWITRFEIGCSEDTFSCQDLNINSKSTCFSKEQRCNNIADCPNHKDEIDCTILSPSLHKKPLFSISNTEGYLHRNFKGTWYAVCSNPYMWAHDACRRETGLIIRPPFIQVIPKDPLLKVNYISTAPSGLIQTSSTCLNSSSIYVTCPDLLCGTRLLSAPHLIKSNTAVENQIFGRNKRFLLQRRPYPKLSYGNRMKRYLTNKNGTFMNNVGKSKITEARNKRAENRVVGGNPSQPAAWPWMIALYRDGVFHCGGVIINQNWIISAAHCVNRFWEFYYEVHVGMLRRFSFSPQEQIHRVTHVIVNQNYDQEDMKNDLSLLRVNPGIQFSRWVRPICLPSPEVAGSDWMWGPAPGTICTAVGWGATEERGPDPDHMREVEIPIWEKCKHKEDQAGKEICAGLAEGGRDTCQGDSGGPLLCKNPINVHQWYVAGIVSHGDGCARKGKPGAYTRVSLYVSWIKFYTASKSLPIIQPKQECPGFRCDSGVLKCLPKKRMCDKIIDCLDGEDEYNCEIEIARSLESNLFLNSFTRVANESGNNNKIFNFENTLPKTTDTFLPLELNNENIKGLTTKSSLSTTWNPVFLTSKDQLTDILAPSDLQTTDSSTFFVTSPPKKHSSILNKLEDDIQHASTLEIANESQESEENVQEDFTIDPIKTTSDIIFKEPEANNMESLKISIESMSSILEKKTLKEIDEISEEHKNAETLSKQIETPITEIRNLSQIKVIDTQSNTLPISTEATNGKSTISNQKDNNSEELIIDFINISDFSTEATSEIGIDNVTEATSEIGIDKFTEPTSDQENSESIQIEHDLNNHRPLNTKDKIFEEIEDIILSELQPAKIRKKHLTPLEFQCKRIFQVVKFSARCDRKADCEDGTDESDCTCVDYLAVFDKNLICDGNFDCADGEDEMDCYSCEKDQYLCKKSQFCLDMKYVCDGKQHCPLGEDELDCLTLSNGKDIFFDINGKPEVNLQGYLTKKHEHNWHIVCEKDMTMDQQKEAALHMCRYLGFSSANRHIIKYINLKEIDNNLQSRKSKRSTIDKASVSLSFKVSNTLKEPEFLREECVPNITRTCMALYVYCDHSLFTNFGVNQEFRNNKEISDVSNRVWPWIAKLYINGNYKCTGVLIDLSWIIVSHFCLKNESLNNHHIKVILGSHKTLSSTIGPYEQVYQIDAKKDFYHSKLYLLRLKEPAVYSDMVKPMVVISPYYGDNSNVICVAIGEDKNNKSFNIFLKETDDCDLFSKCFIRLDNYNSCDASDRSEWAGIISCHSNQGWYPAVSFNINNRECGKIIGTDISNLKHDIKFYEEKPLTDNKSLTNDCEGIRCKRGACINLRNVCDGVTNCEDGADESEKACRTKSNICNLDPHHHGCVCPVGQLKCFNGKCIQKELFRDGNDDCEDGTDEPGQTVCSDYLSKVMPSRICDGILNCHDRSDEDPMFCKCFAKKAFNCSEDYCVAMDMVCDGVRDCPNGDDERSCMGLRASKGTPYGTGEVIVRSHGIWHSKCFITRNHTKSELEAICRDLGFISGHAKLLEAFDTLDPHNSIVVDTFSDITLNSNTTIKMRSSPSPIARPVFLAKEDCYPVFIECL